MLLVALPPLEAFLCQDSAVHAEQDVNAEWNTLGSKQQVFLCKNGL
jgi:hypothetical protein